MKYYDYVWQRTKGIDPEHLFDGIPSSLWGDVAVSLYGEILSEVKIKIFYSTEHEYFKKYN